MYIVEFGPIASYTALVNPELEQFINTTGRGGFLLTSPIRLLKFNLAYVPVESSQRVEELLFSVILKKFFNFKLLYSVKSTEPVLVNVALTLALSALITICLSLRGDLNKFIS